MNLDNIIARLKEPSTYAGLAGLALLVGVTTEQFDLYVNSAAGVFAFIAIFLSEGKTDGKT